MAGFTKFQNSNSNDICPIFDPMINPPLWSMNTPGKESVTKHNTICAHKDVKKKIYETPDYISFFIRVQPKRWKSADMTY